MSLKAYIHVWENSKAKGTSLLALLALADNAHNETGECWPGMATIARKIRSSEDQARRLVNQLIKAREVVRVARPGKTHLYVLVMTGINCASYEELCARYDVEPEAEKIIKDKRGGKRQKKKQPLANMQPPDGVANMQGQGVANMQVQPLANMQPEPFIELSYEPKDPLTPTTITNLEGVDQRKKAATERGGEGENTPLRPSTEKPKSQRKRDLVFDAVVETCFDTNPFNRVEVEQLGSRVAKISNTLKRVYKPSFNEQQLAEKLRAFRVYWAGKGLSMPQNEASLLPNFKKFLDNGSHHQPGEKAAAPFKPHRIYGDDCPGCNGGLGHDGMLFTEGIGAKHCEVCWVLVPEGISNG